MGNEASVHSACPRAPSQSTAVHRLSRHKDPAHDKPLLLSPGFALPAVVLLLRRKLSTFPLPLPFPRTRITDSKASIMLQQAPWRTREEKPTSMTAASASPTPLEAGKMVNGMRIIESEDSQATHPSKLDKEPLLESIYQEVTGGGSVKSLSPHRLMQASKTALLCCLYMGIGPTLILLNKHILKDLDGGQGFNYPMFLSSLGLISSSIVAHLAVRVFGYELPNQARMTGQMYLHNVVPVGICQAATLALGNSVYMFLTVSFIQMLKAFTPVMVLAVGVLFQVEASEPRIIMAVMGICLGTALASFGEMNFNLLGIFLMTAAELTEAVRLILVQKFLQSLRFGIVESQYYMAPAGAVCLMGASVLTEYKSMHANGAFSQLVAHPALFFFAGTLGVGVNFFSYLVVQQTNSVTLKVLGTARNAGLVLLSVYIYGELVSGTQALGYTVSLCFFGLYSYFKTTKNV